MINSLKIKEFEQRVKNKFDIYNSLFLNLPYPNVNNIGMLIPLLHSVCKHGLESGKDPQETLDYFFDTHTNIKSEKEKIDFMFRVIQYVERQVVLYDSVEDAAFKDLLELEDKLSLKDYIKMLDNKNDDDDSIINKLSSFSTRIVLTAHPTQFYPPAVLDIIAKLKTLITNNSIDEIDITLRQLGLTSLINSEKPTPFDEAKNIIYFLRNVYYDAVIDIYAGIKKNLKSSDFKNHKILRFGFWPGGDRDGNPFVTANITKDVADELRMNLMKCYYKDLKALEKKLTFRGIKEIISSLRSRLYVTMFDKNKTIKYDNILNPLIEIKEHLASNFNGIYIQDVENLIDKVEIFRTHFASLDIRQNHTVHKQVVEEILVKEGFVKNNIDELDKEELKHILLNENFNIDANDFSDTIVSDTIRTISQIKDIQIKNGEEGCNRYIISNSEDIFAVLYVFSLLRWCCWKQEDIPIDIIPLFESMESMKNSANIMKELFDTTEYKSHLLQRSRIQTVMLGFSDGTKDGGYLQANWSIFKTKENLSKLCEGYDIKPIFFDGRGGPPARGGGKTHSFYASQSKNIANHAIELTIQGQTISINYGTKEHFIYNCEQLITSGLYQSLSDSENIISGESREIIESLARLSFVKYNELKNHKMFIPYLENKSTLKFYGDTNIGSRPTKRGKKDKLDLKDLRAIPFVGSWSQLKQNVPGYFGLGTALKEMVNDGYLDKLQKLFKEVPFFRTLMLNSMMSLTKCYFDLTKYIANDKQFKDFWNILHDEYLLSKEMTLLISQYEILMQEEPVSRKSIEIRENIVLPLLVIQQYAFQKTEQGSSHSLNYQKIIRRSLYGNINASRNSA